MIGSLFATLLLASCSTHDECLTKEEEVPPTEGADEPCDVTDPASCPKGADCIDVSDKVGYSSGGYGAPTPYFCLLACEDGPTDCPSPAPKPISDCGIDAGVCDDGYCRPSKIYRWDEVLGWVVAYGDTSAP